MLKNYQFCILWSCSLLLCATVFLGNPLLAEEEALTNDVVIELSKAGVAPTIIINKIVASPTKFDVSVQQILKLKKDNVSDEVVNAMIQAVNKQTRNKVIPLVAADSNEFVLVQVETTNKKREMTVGQFNVFGSESGTLDKYVREFEYEKIATGVYKVTPKKELDDGEYAFFYGGTTPVPTYGVINANGGKVFDFGICTGREKKKREEIKDAE